MNTPQGEVARRAPAQPVPVDDLMSPLLNLDQAMRVSEVVCRSDMVPRSLYGKAPNTFHVIMTGQALGLHWTEAVRVIFSPGPGQIGMRAQFLLHQVRKAGHRYTIEPLPDACKVTIKRGDTEEVFESTFTIDDAIQGGLVKRNADGKLVALSREGKPLPWMQWDKKMLRWRAVTDCVSFAVPEAGLGFEIDGGTPEPPQPVELRPEGPAPPAPDGGKAAPSDSQAAQAERLRALDEHTRLSQEIGEAEPFTVTKEQAEALATAAETRADPQMGKPENQPSEETVGPTAMPATPQGGEAGPSTQVTEANSPTAGPPPDEPKSAADRAKQKQLSEWFTTMGYDPRRYRPQVLHACSVFCQRPVTGVTHMRASEVMELCDTLSVLHRRQDELAPVSRLADQVDVWAQRWRETDPDGYTAYEESFTRKDEQ